MFCPRCGQQCSIDVRFCSRCGLPLNVIAEVTANLGMAVWDGGNAPLTPKAPRQGTRVGTILMLAAVAASPLFFALAVLFDGPGPLVAPVTLFLTGLCFVLYSRAFREDALNVQRQPYPILNPPINPVISIPERPSIDAFGSRKVNTSDMAEPPSVTDHTTQFFD